LLLLLLSFQFTDGLSFQLGKLLLLRLQQALQLHLMLCAQSELRLHNGDGRQRCSWQRGGQ
jgi:hypothetical protein